MGGILSVASAVVSAGSAVASLASSGPKQQALPVPVVRDDASSMIDASDKLAQRRGGASDILNGDSGFSKALPGPKTTLGS
ncbi:hypothetical protein [Novosphingobium capsulatum]|uniref:hypothetical protein n=1 Tax=Novosphingobium capsulatum TaxID=13688 RepID=UPI002E0F2574|nr:hypothetical protein U0041_03990 [Novosphingobium capsulatum]